MPSIQCVCAYDFAINVPMDECCHDTRSPCLVRCNRGFLLRWQVVSLIDLNQIHILLSTYWLLGNPPPPQSSVWKPPTRNLTFYSPVTDWCKVHTRKQGVDIQDLFSYISSHPPSPILAPHFLLGVGPRLYLSTTTRYLSQHRTHTHTHPHPCAWCKRHVTSVLSPVGSSCPRPHPHPFWTPGREEEGVGAVWQGYIAEEKGMKGGSRVCVCVFARWQ